MSLMHQGKLYYSIEYSGGICLSFTLLNTTKIDYAIRYYNLLLIKISYAYIYAKRIKIIIIISITIIYIIISSNINVCIHFFEPAIITYYHGRLLCRIKIV